MSVRILSRALVLEKVRYCPVCGWFLNRRTGRPYLTRTHEGYIKINVGGRPHGAHRLAWLIAHDEWPAGHIDHINRIRDDNRLLNLRHVSPGENARNREFRNTIAHLKARGHSQRDGARFLP